MGDANETVDHVGLGIKIGGGAVNTIAGYSIERAYTSDISARLPSVHLKAPAVIDNISQGLFDKIHGSTTPGSNVNGAADV